ncbi:MAG TPA: LamG-like jellyroll fold domain-containing protein, partial [Candidatus Limnocylindria bacterium]|nr:LamG-like jellyroll fold domain-containing protein [Candidatus Limnocylindria bacterium]
GGRPMTFTWFHDDVIVPDSTASALVLKPVTMTDAGYYRLVASNSFGVVTSSVARLQVANTSITDALVLHLTFDGQLDDSSGRSNHAAYAFNGLNAKKMPTFAAGQIGQAFQYTTLADGSRIEYATLGYPPDLQLGANTDFTVSMWVNYTNQMGDPPFISNKDWNRSHFQGWAITTQNGGTFRVNATGPNEGADFFTTATTPVIRNGRWHHLLVSFQRAASGQSAYVYTYVDGKLTDRTPAAISGTIDTLELPFNSGGSIPTSQHTWAVNIGQDGTGAFLYNGSASAVGVKIDDLGIWRRALTSKEAEAIYAAGLAGQDLTHATVPLLLFASLSKETVGLSWAGRAGVWLETNASLAPDQWVRVADSEGSSGMTLPLNGQAAYFRLAQRP